MDGKSTQENVTLVKNWILESLQWMIDDGVAARLEVDAWRFGLPGNYRLGFQVDIYKVDGEVTSVKFDDLWEAQYAV
jgi:phage gp46-like protein